MPFGRPIFVAALVLGLLPHASAAESWKAMKTGLTTTETAAVLGQPLIKSHGRNFDLWVYDSGAEVVYLYGIVVAWTSPAGVTTTGGRDIDVKAVLARAEANAKKRYGPVRVTDAEYEPVGTRVFRLPQL
jgi:hypothetical protein